MSAVILVRYSDNPLANDAVIQNLNITGQSYTYIVATAAQEFMRGNLAPSHQIKALKGPQLVFHKAIRHLLPAGINIVTRAEERVTLQRAMRAITSEEDRFQRLKHDTAAWRDVLTQLDEQGINLAEGLPADLQQRLVHPDIEELLIELQQRYRTMLGAEKYRTFEQAAFQFLRSSRFTPTPHVIMEGFTFLTPLQQHFVAECLKRPVTLHFVHPFRDEQTGFAIMRRTYAAYENYPTRLIVGSFPSVASDIGILRNSLFLDEAPPPAATDGSVTFSVFSHRHGEAKRCIERIREYLVEEPGWQIAVVTRDPAAFHMLLQEEAELQDPNLSLGIPPRLLLLTPVGRFLLTLYAIWQDGLNVDAEQFEAIITSGWLGAVVQETVERFRAVKSQMFARCRAADDWRASLALLRQLRQTLPEANSARSGFRALGNDRVLGRCIGASRTAMHPAVLRGEGSIGDHVRSPAA